jgi:hypothetical protein
MKNTYCEEGNGEKVGKWSQIANTDNNYHENIHQAGPCFELKLRDEFNKHQL